MSQELETFGVWPSKTTQEGLTQSLPLWPKFNLTQSSEQAQPHPQGHHSTCGQLLPNPQPARSKGASEDDPPHSTHSTVLVTWMGLRKAILEEKQA